MKCKIQTICFIIIIGFCYPVYSSPAFKISSSCPVAEKGHTFQIFIEIETKEPLHDNIISIAEPEGFYVETVESPGVKTADEGETKSCGMARIARLGRDSAMTVSFEVWPPDLSGNPKVGDKQSLYSTREPKTFPIKN